MSSRAREFENYLPYLPQPILHPSKHIDGKSFHMNNALSATEDSWNHKSPQSPISSPSILDSDLIEKLMEQHQNLKSCERCLNRVVEILEQEQHSSLLLQRKWQNLHRVNGHLGFHIRELENLLSHRERAVSYWEGIAQIWADRASLLQQIINQQLQQRKDILAIIESRNREHENRELNWRRYLGDLESYHESRYQRELEKRRSIQRSLGYRICKILGLTKPLSDRNSIQRPLPIELSSFNVPEHPNTGNVEVPPMPPLPQAPNQTGPAFSDPCPDQDKRYHAGLDCPNAMVTRYAGYKVHVAGWILDETGKVPAKVWAICNGIKEPCVIGKRRMDVVKQFEGQFICDPFCGFSCELETASGVNVISVEAEFADHQILEVFRRTVVNMGVHSAPRGQADQDYQTWVSLYDTPDKNDAETAKRIIDRFSLLPTISVLVPVFNTNVKFLALTIESVIGQWYPRWELILVDDASTNPEVREVMHDYASRDQRIIIRFRDNTGHISAASNTALSLASGEFCALLDHDDTLSPDAIFWVVECINRHPDATLIFSDEDKIDPDDNRFDPYFKPDWNPDLLLSHNCVSHLGVYRRKVLDTIGGFDENLSGSQDWDLALTVSRNVDHSTIHHIPRVLYHWRYVNTSTSHSIEAKPYAAIAAKTAIEKHLRINRVAAIVENGPWSGSFRVRYPVKRRISTTILIDSGNDFITLKRCVDSVLNRTDYSNFDIMIIDRNTGDNLVFQYLAEIQKNGRVGVNKLHGFAWVRAISKISTVSNSEVLIFLDTHCEVFDPSWLEEMVGQTGRDEVGAVGLRILNPNHTIWHAGTILGVAGIASNAFQGIGEWDLGHMGRAQLAQSYSAVNGKCLATRNSTFRAICAQSNAPLNESFWDVDFCLRTRFELGLRSMWTPFASVILHDSADDASLKAAMTVPFRIREDEVDMRQRWSHIIDNDPSYNSNLTRSRRDFQLAWPPKVPRVGDLAKSISHSRPSLQPVQNETGNGN